ncbi:MAG: glycosyltransferase family 39 protein [bacterium]
MTDSDDRKFPIFTQKRISFLIILVGIILRLAQYIFNRSLTEGEAALALNIIQRSYAQLLKPLDYVQAAPVGFLLLQKFVSNLFGTNEYALRLFPLIAGIGALFLFYEIAKKTLSKQSLIIGLILFAVGDHLIYFTSEVKQYSSDVLVALLLIWLAIFVFNKKFDTRYVLLFGFIGGLCLWFSHPALFVLGAGLVTMYLYVLRKRSYSKIPTLVFATIFGLGSFIINYIVTLNDLSQSETLMTFWQNSFMPLPPTSLADFKWFGYVFLRTFKFPVGLSPYELFLAVLAFFWGCFLMYKYKTRYLLLIILPICLALLASGLGRYPFEGRLLLFLTPFMILIIAQGISDIQLKLKSRSNFLGLALVFILLVQPVLLAGYRLIRPRAPEELRSTLDYVEANWQKEDMIYVYYASLNAFLYYQNRYDFQNQYVCGIESRSRWTKYYLDLSRLKGNKRVWFVFSHIATGHGVDEKRLIKSYLDLLGEQLAAFQAPGSAAYLYDMTADQLLDRPE